MTCAGQQQRFEEISGMSVKPTKPWSSPPVLACAMRPLTDRMQKPLVARRRPRAARPCARQLGDAGGQRSYRQCALFPDQIIDHVAARARPRVIISDERHEVLGTGGGVVRHCPRSAAPRFSCQCRQHVDRWRAAQSGALAEAFDPAHMDILLLMAPTTSSIGLADAAITRCLRDGALRKRRGTSGRPLRSMPARRS